MTNLQNLTLFLSLWILFFGIGCSSKTDYETVQSGRLKFIKTLKYGSVGTHGSQGWYVSERNFYVNDRSWKPEGIDVNDNLISCESSPNREVEALKCESPANLKEWTFVLRMKDDKPEWMVASESPYDKGKNYGEWTGDGKWLLFFDSLFNVETFEKREVKGLPSAPEDHFRAVSPDLEKIIYQGDCFSGGNLSEEVERRRKRTCDNHDDYFKNKTEVLWIIEAKTGETKLLELSREKYDWLVWDKNKFQDQQKWKDFYLQQIIWGKDPDGKYQLVSPK